MFKSKAATASSMAAPREPMRLAVLHQAIEPPVIGGVRKAMKPGGYKDSSADIAYVLDHISRTSSRSEPEVEVVTPQGNPDPSTDAAWSFPDTESGILAALRDHHANRIWANTILFSSHPLQTSKDLNEIADQIHVVGQPPQLVERYDDKNWVNSVLGEAKDPTFRLPASWIVNWDHPDEQEHLRTHLSELNLPYPVVGKPIRGRGSHGVKLCRSETELVAHMQAILAESPQVMIEEYLAGQEGTVTVMPPGKQREQYWALPVVERFNHADGIAPYNGVVAVLNNSRVVPLHTQGYSIRSDTDVDGADTALDSDNAYVDIRRQCELVAQTLACTAPIRIDIRRRKEGGGTTTDNPFVMFDINMKPNMTGPGRPGRENQASLTAMAAEALGWDYARLLLEVLATARPLNQLRRISVPRALQAVGR